MPEWLGWPWSVIFKHVIGSAEKKIQTEYELENGDFEPFFPGPQSHLSRLEGLR